MLTHCNLVLTVLFLLCAEMTSGLSIVDKEVQIMRTPGTLILKDRSTTPDIYLPVLPGHTWFADFQHIYDGNAYFKSWRVNDRVVAEGYSIRTTVAPNDIGSIFYLEAGDWGGSGVRGPRVHLVLAPAPNITSALPKSVDVFPKDYVDLTIENINEDGLTIYSWDIEKIPLSLQTTSNVRVRANEDLHGAKLTVTVANAAGKVSSSTIINVLPPRGTIALIVIGGFIFLCGVVIGVLLALRKFGLVTITLRKRPKNTVEYAQVNTTVTEVQEDDNSSALKTSLFPEID
eukprot:TRINITY_DN1990_c0_g1_i1.p1 TRINITY_DN1990_c0_g1~~TRINITY_DN1990_c0_g1_i1.p1  ORF type:complete len:288 (-),score=24.71 TRINITY_DN1990_c0_g1_i1:89-952(-)